jgi:hypothetical protein
VVPAALMFYEDRPNTEVQLLLNPNLPPVRGSGSRPSVTWGMNRRGSFLMIFGWFFDDFGWFLDDFGWFLDDSWWFLTTSRPTFLGRFKTCRWQNFEFVVGIAPSGQLSLDCKFQEFQTIPNHRPGQRQSIRKFTQVTCLVDIHHESWCDDFTFSFSYEHLPYQVTRHLLWSSGTGQGNP